MNIKSTSAATPVTEKLAETLIHRAADWIEATRPIDSKVLRARLDGAGDAAHALGYGMTPMHVTMIAADWVRANPRPPGGMSYGDARKGWAAVGAVAVGLELFNSGPDAAPPPRRPRRPMQRLWRLGTPRLFLLSWAMPLT